MLVGGAGSSNLSACARTANAAKDVDFSGDGGARVRLAGPVRGARGGEEGGGGGTEASLPPPITARASRSR